MSTSSWTNTNGGNWGDSGNWTNGVPNGSTANANIAAAGTYTVSVNGTYEANDVNVTDAGATLSINSGSGTLTIDDVLDLSAGSLEIQGTLAFAALGKVTVAAASSVRINGGTIKGGTLGGSGLIHAINNSVLDGTASALTIARARRSASTTTTSCFSQAEPARRRA